MRNSNARAALKQQLKKQNKNPPFFFKGGTVSIRQKQQLEIKVDKPETKQQTATASPALGEKQPIPSCRWAAEEGLHPGRVCGFVSTEMFNLRACIVGCKTCNISAHLRPDNERRPYWRSLTLVSHGHSITSCLSSQRI